MKYLTQKLLFSFQIGQKRPEGEEEGDLGLYAHSLSYQRQQELLMQDEQEQGRLLQDQQEQSML